MSYSFILLGLVFLIALILFAGMYSVVDDMQERISQYVKINQLSSDLSKAKVQFTDYFDALQGGDSEEALLRYADLRATQYKSLLGAKNLKVPYEVNKDKYFLSNSIANGLEHIMGLIDDISENGSIPIQPEVFSKYYWGLKVYDYLLDFTYNQYLSAAVDSDVVASVANMTRIAMNKGISVMMMIIMLIICFTITYYITSRLTKPISSMVTTAKDITQGNLSTPDLDIPGPEELYFLETSMNQMKASLQERMRLENRLHRHELEQVRMTRELERARYLSLQAQINPHFLFNTLNTIQRTAMFENAQSTMQLINSLASIFRYSLEFEDDVEVGRELAFIKQYLSIQQARFGERIAYEITCDDSLESVHIPPLVIQPFVENAIIHGLEPLEEGGEVRIDVAPLAEGKMCITISNNGVGFVAPSVENIPEHKNRRSHIGISNVRDRLRAVYQDGASLTVGRGDGDIGTKVVIILPTVMNDMGIDAIRRSN